MTDTFKSLGDVAAGLTRKLKPVYWCGDVPSTDDFSLLIDDEIIDGKTKNGPWALMTPASWRRHGIGHLGLGRGQRYKKQPDGKWLKVEG